MGHMMAIKKHPSSLYSFHQIFTGLLSGVDTEERQNVVISSKEDNKCKHMRK